jgi:hypothetical protein
LDEVLEIMFSVKENPGYHGVKQHKSWFDKECSKQLDQQKQEMVAESEPNDCR